MRTHITWFTIYGSVLYEFAYLLACKSHTEYSLWDHQPQIISSDDFFPFSSLISYDFFSRILFVLGVTHKRHANELQKPNREKKIECWMNVCMNIYKRAVELVRVYEWCVVIIISCSYDVCVAFIGANKQENSDNCYAVRNKNNEILTHTGAHVVERNARARLSIKVYRLWGNRNGKKRV